MTRLTPRQRQIYEFLKQHLLNRSECALLRERGRNDLAAEEEDETLTPSDSEQPTSRSQDLPD